MRAVLGKADALCAAAEARVVADGGDAKAVRDVEKRLDALLRSISRQTVKEGSGRGVRASGARSSEAKARRADQSRRGVHGARRGRVARRVDL